MNPDHYEAWNVRKEAIEKASAGGEEVDRIIAEDMKLSRECLTFNPKSFNFTHQPFGKLRLVVPAQVAHEQRAHRKAEPAEGAGAHRKAIGFRRSKLSDFNF